LSVPGSSERKLAKAAQFAVDEVVIDLEDAVIAAGKDDARAAAVEALEAWGGGITAVRVNAPRSRWCHVDIVAIASVAEQPASIVVPKVESAADLAFVDRLLDGVEAASGRRDHVRVQALIETARGLANVDQIAAASARLDSLILGYADLAASLGATRELDWWLPAQHATLTAARTNGLQMIDGAYLGVEVDPGFIAAAQRVRDLGFDGKWAIHPAQVPFLQQLFAPTEDELSKARAVIDALERAALEGGAGAATLDGEMIDEAIRLQALRVLERAGSDAA
jgi:citrate lyase subunit beta/citryl-CoA lyase